MKVNVGSKNPNKVLAVEEALLDFPEYFFNTEVTYSEADSGVSNQPKKMEEIIQGAMSRAKNAFIDCDISVGIESGLMEVPNTKSGYMEITICAIYDGKIFHLGGSSAFEYPKAMIDLVFSKYYDINQAAKEIGFTENSNVGSAEGVVGLLTKGHLNRKNHSKQAVITALIHLLNPEHY